MLQVSLLAPAIVVLAACTARSQQPAPQARRVGVPVTVAQVTLRSVPIQIRAIGNVEAYSTISVKAQVPGELTHVHFQEGDFVKKGQLLFQLDPRQYEQQVKQQEGALAKDAANAANAQADARRYTELLRQGIVARQETEAKSAAANALEATLQADRAAIDYAKLQLLYTTIRSPIDGRTGNLAVKEGNLVKDHDVALVTINQIQPIYVSFSVPEGDFAAVQGRLANRLPVEALLNGAGQKPIRGALTFADNAVDQTTGTIRLKATFPNTDNKLWPGQFVNVVLTTGTQSNAVLVPSEAVQTGQKGQFVFIVDANRKVQMHVVTVDRAVGNLIALSSGVRPGDTVVTDGQSRLVPDTEVEIVKTPVAAEGSPGS